MPRKSIEELVRRNLKRLVDHAVKHLELADLDVIYAENELLNLFSVTEPYVGDIGEYELYQVLDELFEVAVKRKMYLESDRALLKAE